MLFEGFETLVVYATLLLVATVTLPRIFRSMRAKPAQPMSGLAILRTVKASDLIDNPKLLEVIEKVSEMEMKYMKMKADAQSTIAQNSWMGRMFTQPSVQE